MLWQPAACESLCLGEGGEAEEEILETSACRRLGLKDRRRKVQLHDARRSSSGINSLEATAEKVEDD